MANNNIQVNKQNVVDLLKSGKEHTFVIPEYQRPYAWSDDEIITLFDDLWDFSIERSNENGPKTYFLGSIVSFENDNGEKEIIDGQQRITSLFLLLRAIYSKLEHEENKTKEVNNFIKRIEPALWLVDEYTGDVDKTNILLRSEVATDQGNEILRRILETGITDKDAKDNYSRNYRKFIELYENKAVGSTMQVFHFINALLNYSILLPISADNQDTALTIFSTLNNRGLPLSDADIFKSLIYKKLNAEEKKKFAQQWKELEAEVAEYGESIQSLFNYHMFYLRAKDGDVKTTTPGVRKFFTEKGKDRLKPEVIKELAESLNLWKVIRGKETLENESWSENKDILKVLDILTSYNNEYWKYPTLIYYNTHKNNPRFEELFIKFLRKLCVLLVTRYLEQPTISAVKDSIFKLNAAIIKTPEPEFTVGFKSESSENEANPLIIMPPRSLVRMLLKMLAYNNTNQKELLPDKWEIEHIFPQKWDTSFFNLNSEETNAKLEHLGNKIPLEKPMNIRASNNYFDRKKEQYGKSAMSITKDFAGLSFVNWLPEDIIRRDKELSDELTSIFDKWVSEYDTIKNEIAKPVPTPEEEEMLRHLREKGLI